MGERKGQNHYYPPDFDPKKHGNLNRYHGVHALRERAAKISQGILIIRFEMPFNIWCLGCDRHIAMSVRYNAEKKRVGNYFSTPIYEFKMRCHLCETYFIIRTDPKNMDYELIEGCRRQEKRWDPGEHGGHPLHDRTKALKIASDSMFKLENTEEDKKKASGMGPQVEQIEDIQYRMKDDFGANQYLRSQLRTTKKEAAKQQKSDDNLRSRLSLEGLPLVKEHDDDKKLASLMSMYAGASSEELQELQRKNIITESIFAKNAGVETLSTPSSSSTASNSSVFGGSKLKLQTDKPAAKSLVDTITRHAVIGVKRKSDNHQKCTKASLSNLVVKRTKHNSTGLEPPTKESMSDTLPLNYGNDMSEPLVSTIDATLGIDHTTVATETRTLPHDHDDMKGNSSLGCLASYSSGSDESDS